VDEETGQTTTTETPSTPVDPAEVFLDDVRKVLWLMDVADDTAGERISAVSHGTTVATNHLRGRSRATPRRLTCRDRR
jgi:N-methylhydantoinase A